MFKKGPKVVQNWSINGSTVKKGPKSFQKVSKNIPKNCPDVIEHFKSDFCIVKCVNCKW